MATGGPPRGGGASGHGRSSHVAREWAASSARNLARRLRRRWAATASVNLTERSGALRRALDAHARLDDWNGFHCHNMGSALAAARGSGLPTPDVVDALVAKRAGDVARHAAFVQLPREAASLGLGSFDGPAAPSVQYVVVQVPVERVVVVPQYIVVDKCGCGDSVQAAGGCFSAGDDGAFSAAGAWFPLPERRRILHAHISALRENMATWQARVALATAALDSVVDETECASAGTAVCPDAIVEALDDASGSSPDDVSGYSSDGPVSDADDEELFDVLFDLQARSGDAIVVD